MPTANDFREALYAWFRRAEEERRAEGKEESFIEINAGELHREVGGYPEPCNRMPSCCNVMYGEMTDDDKVVASPPEGRGASLTICYRLPRR